MVFDSAIPQQPATPSTPRALLEQSAPRNACCSTVPDTQLAPRLAYATTWCRERVPAPGPTDATAARAAPAMGVLPWQPLQTYALGVGARGGRSSNTHSSRKSDLCSTGRPAVIKIRRHTVPGPLENRRPDGRHTRGRFARRYGEWFSLRGRAAGQCPPRLACSEPLCVGGGCDDASHAESGACQRDVSVTLRESGTFPPAPAAEDFPSERRKCPKEDTALPPVGVAGQVGEPPPPDSATVATVPGTPPAALQARRASRRRPAPRRWRLSPGRLRRVAAFYDLTGPAGQKPVYRLILREYTGFPTASGCRRKAVYFFSREYTGFLNTPLFTKPVYIRPFKVHWYTEIRVHWIQYSHL